MIDGGRDVRLALARNPGGYTEMLQALLGDGQPKHMLLALGRLRDWLLRQGYAGMLGKR